MTELDPQELFIDGAEPYGLDASAKQAHLMGQLAALRDFHRSRCAGYAQLLKDWETDHSATSESIEDYPFIPVSVFKEYELKSSDQDLAVVKSSGTTSQQSSKIFTDKASRKRQARSANAILADFIGAQRRPYLVFDLESTVRGTQAFSARGAAIMALAHMASEFHFVMREGSAGLELDESALRKAVDAIGDQAFIAYGFTFILYQAHQQMQKLQLAPAHPDSVFLHSGGWKKLVDLAVDKSVFNAMVAKPWQLPAQQVVDFYGAVEQIGMPYPDCNAGYKHVPYWADVITRKADSLAPTEAGESGLIQLLSCLPLSAPNHSVLTEDLGRIAMLDGCSCGRSGKAFTFEGRAPRSEIRGCSDVARR